MAYLYVICIQLTLKHVDSAILSGDSIRATKGQNAGKAGNKQWLPD